LQESLNFGGSDRLLPYVRPVGCRSKGGWPRWVPRRKLQPVGTVSFCRWTSRDVLRLGSIDRAIFSFVLQTPNPGLAFSSPLYGVYAQQAPRRNFARPSLTAMRCERSCWRAPPRPATLWQTGAVETQDTGADHGSDYSHWHGHVEAQFPTTWRQLG
jgi:hypothetical protein